MYQPKTGQKCYCKKGIERDNCANCEGTGMVIDFKLIRHNHTNEKISDPNKRTQNNYCLACKDWFSPPHIKEA